MWRECVMSFSKRNLTVANDRLVAISGIARLLRRSAYNDRFLAGLWEDALPYDLLWLCDQTSNLTQEKPRNPSWSWISIDCGIDWPKRERKEDEEPLHYISSATYFERGLEPVECLSATELEIVLSARMVPVYPEKDVGSDSWVVRTLHQRSLPFYPDILLPKEHIRTRQVTQTCMTNSLYHYLEIIKSEPDQKGWQVGLIVRPSNIAERKFERVGIAGDMTCDPQNYFSCWFDGEMRQKVILV